MSEATENLLSVRDSGAYLAEWQNRTRTISPSEKKKEREKDAKIMCVR